MSAPLPSARAGGRFLARSHTADLSGRLGFIQGAAGSRFGPLVLKNHSRHTCTLFGYIGGQLYHPAGRPLPPPLLRGRSRPRRPLTPAPGRGAVAGPPRAAVPTGGAPHRP